MVFAIGTIILIWTLAVPFSPVAFAVTSLPCGSSSRVGKGLVASLVVAIVFFATAAIGLGLPRLRGLLFLGLGLLGFTPVVSYFFVAFGPVLNLG